MGDKKTLSSNEIISSRTGADFILVVLCLDVNNFFRTHIA